MSGLIISDRRERALVRTADALLAPAALLRRRMDASPPPARILCLRLERIGDLLMTLPALAALRSAYRAAHIDLAVGSWNRELASALPMVDAVLTLDAAWLARADGGVGVAGLLRRAFDWRRVRYDLAINFEPDIRSNAAARASGAGIAAGFASGGGGALLDVAVDYDATVHTRDNALALVRAIAGASASVPAGALLAIPASHRDAAQARLGSDDRLFVGMHVSGGRLVKQWPLEQFRETARRLIADRGATIVFTGARADRALIDDVCSTLPRSHVIDAASEDSLLTVAAILERVALLVTGDTGPMHLGVAVATPVVALFGSTNPVRTGPYG
ncbi:MAG TPA: glycosyltransferase family 9 protein, partial [Vicinamibacterales bacterium]